MSEIKEIRDVLYGEEYEKGGEKKTKWTKCGTMFIKDTNIGIKLTAIPLGTQNLVAFPPKPKEEQPAKEVEKDSGLPF